MREPVELHGMILKASTLGEYDRRLVILTKEQGKITVFAKGAGRPGSALMGRTRPMAFGEFRLFPGRDAYRLSGAEIINYFDELTADFTGIAYACYFLELADYYGREFVDGKDTLNLLYVSFQALKKKTISESLIRSIFELKLLTINGEYPIPERSGGCEATVYTMQFIIQTPIEKLYSFTVSEQVDKELREILDRHMKEVIGKTFHSLDLLRLS